MQNNLDKYTAELKKRLDENFLSPLFIRLANLLYVNEHYEECITVSRTGLEIYPRYVTAKLVLLRALIKAEYLSEAEMVLKDIRSKISNRELLSRLENNIITLKSISKQERIFYPDSAKTKYDYKTFEKNFHIQENLFSDYTLKDFLIDEADIPDDDNQLESFIEQFEAFHFEKSVQEKQSYHDLPIHKQSPQFEEGDLLSKVKIVTETLADIQASQGNFKEAFEAYNILLRAGSNNSKRIEDKIHELERSLLKE